MRIGMPTGPAKFSKRVVFALAAAAIMSAITPIAVIAYQLHAARVNWQRTMENLQSGDATFEAACVASEELREIEYFVFRSRKRAADGHIIRLYEIDRYRIHRLLSGTSSAKFHRQLDDAMEFDVTKHEAAAHLWLQQINP
jgi:hypothetical protein